MKPILKLLSVIAVIGLMTSSTSVFAAENSALRAKHQKIIQDFPSVQHISTEDLKRMQSEDVIIFDIREEDEFSVSHMADAFLVSPKILPDDFLNQYSEKAKGKTVILYCSVGQRSSLLAEKIQDRLTRSGSGRVYNLEGGLFKWHNENLPLVTHDTKSTQYVHPYNYFWGRMLNQDRKKRYKSEVE